MGYRDSYVFIARRYADNVKGKLVKYNEGFAQIEMAAAGHLLAYKRPDLTPYHYVQKNPINFIVPDGRFDGGVISLPTAFEIDIIVTGVINDLTNKYPDSPDLE